MILIKKVIQLIEEEKLLRLRQYVIDKTFISELKIIKECNLAEEEQENAK